MLKKQLERVLRYGREEPDGWVEKLVVSAGTMLAGRELSEGEWLEDAMGGCLMEFLRKELQ